MFIFCSRARRQTASLVPSPAEKRLCHSFARRAHRFWIEGAPTCSLDRRSDALHRLTARERTGPGRAGGGTLQAHPGRRAFREGLCHSFARRAHRFWIEGAPTCSLDRRSDALHRLTARERTGPGRAGGGTLQAHPGRRAFREGLCHSFARRAHRFWIEGAPTCSLDRRSDALHRLTARERTGPGRAGGGTLQAHPGRRAFREVSATHSRVARTGFGSKAPLRAHLIVVPTHCIG